MIKNRLALMAGLRKQLSGLCPGPFGFAHLAWAILVLAGCVALVLMGGGHPPPMIFVPPLLVAGIFGHLLLLLVAWLLATGQARSVATQGAAPRWPPELVLIAIGLGALAICAIAITIGEVAMLRDRPLAWLLFAVIAVGHATAFVLLLLGRKAARQLIAAISFGWAIALVLQLGEARPGEWPIAAVIIGGLAGLGFYALLSKRIRSVLG